MNKLKVTELTEKEKYDLLPEGTLAEFINGKIYMMSAPSVVHQRISGELFRIISNYILHKGGSCIPFNAPSNVQLFNDRDIVVQPDVFIVCNRDKINDKRIIGAPDIIVEIVSQGNASHDYIRKLNLYKDARVKEYWIVDNNNNNVTVFIFDKNIILDYTFEDNIKVNIFEDLYIDFKEISKMLLFDSY